MNNQRDPDAFYAQVFTQCLRLATTHPVMHDLMFDPRLGEVVGTLAGVNGIRIWHDQALYKPPYGNPTGFHLTIPSGPSIPKMLFRFGWPWTTPPSKMAVSGICREPTKRPVLKPHPSTKIWGHIQNVPRMEADDRRNRALQSGRAVFLTDWRPTPPG